MRRDAAHVDSLRRAVSEGPGHTEASLRQAVSAHAAAHCHGEPSSGLPDDLVGYVDKVALHAYKVTDDDVEALKLAGRSEDEIFEVTVAAAVGAALERLEIGLRALDGGAK
ncbi:MAG: hypothetical protein ACR2OD_11585 [Gaiellaceae bacterium]